MLLLCAAFAALAFTGCPRMEDIVIHFDPSDWYYEGGGVPVIRTNITITGDYLSAATGKPPVRVFFTDGGIADGYVDTTTGDVMLYDDKWNDGKSGGKIFHTLRIISGGTDIPLSRQFHINPATDPVELTLNTHGALAFRAALPNPADSNLPYIPIDTVGELALIGADAVTLAGAYALRRDIDLLGVTMNGNSVLAPPPHNWAPIGNAAAKFTGKFDGDNNTITNLYIDAPASDNVGLFGYIQGAAVKNITLNSCDITGRDNVGGVAGHSTGSVVSNCVKTSGSVNGTTNVNTIVGLTD
jgi:hypothetical protein